MAGGQVTDNNGEAKVGAVLVVGAGIGGMQAALDLADSGFRVYLTDSSPAIGGTMAQLDKTFPTNDCAMCIMSPKLVETGRHLNIDIMTQAQVESISGEAGNFSVRLRRQPRFVDVSKCTGCGDCAAVCPIELPDAFNAQLSTRKAVYKLYPQAIPNAFAIQKRGEAPCRRACPIEQRAMGYIALIREGRFADAYRTIREDNPFPAVCGRVCNHRCEEACSRPSVGETPVSIMRLKRFVSDWARAHPQELAEPPPPAPPNGHRVAVVGSGPAGLSCAGDLARLGYQVTVFEALPVAGGMMRVGIPAYRLPYDALQKDIDDVLAGGVELKLNQHVDDVPALLGQFNAVFVALGAHLGVRLPLPGVDLPDVLVATDFLRQISLMNLKSEGPAIRDPRSAIRNRRVLVLGGGNVAVDAAMSAVRLGASWVGMACLESREKMPAHDWEVRDASEEGIEVMPSRTFKEITGQDGRVTGVRAAQVDFRGFVEGRPDFDEIDGTEELIPCDVVIFAIGQKPDLAPLGGKIDTLRGRTVAVDPDTLATSLPGIFSGGDAVSGTSFVVDAIAAGHKAARSIDAWLRQPDDWPPALEKVERPPVAELDEAQARALIAAKSQSPRAEGDKRPAAQRKRDFDEIESGLSEAQAIEEARRCLECGICSECLQCVYACQADAIRHDEREQIVEVQVGAVILAPGLKTMAGDVRPEFGYGLYPNVVTSMEFERMLSASGPYAGVVQRPSDGHHPRKVAFIQCVGSRDLGCGQDYCSSVCCMYATKEALIAREHDGAIEPTIFYMDIRAFGKGFERYYQRAEAEQGVRYVRSMVSCVKQVPGSQNLRLFYATPDGKNVEEEFELVVLSVGLLPSDGTRELAGCLGVQLNRFGFAESQPYAPTETNVPGIYVAGAFAAPKDIPETVVEASCAAAHASRLLAPARGTLTREPVYPAERDVSHEEVRVGVFVCHCGINIGGVVKVPEVVEYVQGLPNVVYAEHNLYTCSQDTQERIKQRIQELGLNRVVVSSCTPRTHEPLFQDTIRQAGLNPYLFELANIREQDSWVHRADRDVATAKAKDLAAMAVAKATKLRPLYRQNLEIDHRALVVGGGLAGMTAALSIAEQGYDVHLVEREAALGGNLRHIYTEVNSKAAKLQSCKSANRKSKIEDPQALLADLVERVSRNPRIHVYLGAEVDSVSGYVGQYKTGIRLQDGHTEELGHGVVIVATGAQAMTPKEYLYGQHPNVITQIELEARLHASSFQPLPRASSFVMLQCVGSRDDEHPYCSRVCCTQAIKNALVIKQQNPQASVAILYRDIRTYGMHELLYRQAREAGVVFLEYSEKHKPVVAPAAGAAGGALSVELVMQPDGESITLPADWVVLSTGIEPRPDNAALAQFFKLPLSEDHFFLEAHAKLRPLDFAADGVYLAGLAHSPRFIDETIAQANGAALRAVTLLSRKELQSAALIAEVNPRLCSSCGVCVEACPYNARLIDEEKGHAVVLEVLCQGCGACVSACPNGASFQRGFEFGQIFGMIDAALERV